MVPLGLGELQLPWSLPNKLEPEVLSGGMIAQCHVDHKTGFWKKRFSEERFSKNRCCLYTVCKYSAYTSMAQAVSGLHAPKFCIHVACIRDMYSSRAEGDRPVHLVQWQFGGPARTWSRR